MKDYIEVTYRDFMMNELKVGDKVLFVEMVCKYPCLSTGKVSGFTPKKVRINKSEGGNTTVAPERIAKIISEGVVAK